MGISRMQRNIAVLWPSFLTAGVATIVFFTLFDPYDLFPTQEVSRLGCYSVGFFLFWVLTAGTSMLTCFFQKPCENKRAASQSSDHGSAD